MGWLPLKVTETIFFLMSGMTHQWHAVKFKKTLKYFLLGLKCLVSPPSVGRLKVCGTLPALCHMSLFLMLRYRKILNFFSVSYFFTKSINTVAVHTISLHSLGQILWKKYIKIPHPYGGYIHQQQIFQQESCPVMIQVLDSDFWISSGTQLQEGNGSHIVSYFDDDDDVKAKMVPVITGATGTTSRAFRKYEARLIIHLPKQERRQWVDWNKSVHVGTCLEVSHMQRQLSAILSDWQHVKWTCVGGS